MQGLLKKVYQESCRILTLSQRRVNPSAQSHVLDLKACSLSLSQHHAEDGSALLHHQDKSSNPPMSWQQEKRALQETVIALRELLCRMAQRHSQVSFKRWFKISSILRIICFKSVIGMKVLFSFRCKMSLT